MLYYWKVFLGSSVYTPGNGVKYMFSRLKLKDKILYLVLSVVLIVLVFSTFISYSLAKRVFMTEYQSRKEQVAEHVISSVKLIDAGYGMLEKNLEAEMGKVMAEFKVLFAEAGGDPDKVSLQELKAKLKTKYELIIIDSKTTVVKATVPQAMDFNFMEFDKQLGDKINQIRLSGETIHEKIRTNVGTGYLSKFTYTGTDDHKYVLELAYEEGGLSRLVSRLEPLTITSQLVDTIPMVSSIRIFDVFGYEFVDGGESYKPTEESLAIVDRAKKEKSYEVADTGRTRSFYFIDLKTSEDKMTDNSKIVEIVYDNTAMVHSLRSIAYSACMAGLIGIFIITIMILIISKRITYPLTVLMSAAKRAARGDYAVKAEKISHDEIGELSDVFNSVMEKIKENFEKIENQKNELEDYNRNLENKVKDRTAQLAATLEESKNTQQLLKNSNLQFENLFHNMQEGFAIHEIISDDKGKPVDYRFLDANGAFERITSLRIEDIKGRTVLEVLPDTEASWIEKYGRVAMTGEPISCENYSKELNKYFSINAFCPVIGQFATIFTDITSQVLSKEEIQRGKYILERILDEALSGYWDWDMQKDTIYLSPGLKKMLGYEDHELENSPETLPKLLNQDDQKTVEAHFLQHVESHGRLPFYNEVRYTHKDGSIVWLINAGHVVEWDVDGKPLQMVGCHINITDIKKLEKSLSEERELLKATLLSIGDGVISTNRNGRIEIVNAVAERLTGWSQTEACGKAFEEVFRIINDATGEICENPLNSALEAGKMVEPADNIILISRDGSERPIEESAASIRDDSGNISGAVIIFRDFTEKKEKQDRIEYLSFHDQLTGLYNRRFLEEEILRIDCLKYLPLTLVMLDVNGLKLINDAFGHSMGDKVLQKTAEILMKECRSIDTVARFGGDEFIILMPGTGESDVDAVLKRINNRISEEKLGSISISISYGWATKNKVSENITDIFKLAEDYMYRRKLSESKSMHYRTVEIILQTLREKSEREKKHSDRVSSLCEAIGAAYGFDKEELRELKTSGLMHDIGKIAIDLSILDKPEKLTLAERIEIERHPEQGYQILRSINEFARLAEYVLAHHERWDGKGYPGALRGEEIPLEARIIAIADSYDAMTSDRPYRQAMTREAAAEELQRNAGSQFDPQLVSVFIEKVFRKI